MSKHLCDLLAEDLSRFCNDEEAIQSLAEKIKEAGDEGPLWEIYTSLRLHKLAKAGDQGAEQALASLRSKASPTQQLKANCSEETWKMFGEIVESLPQSWSGAQNQTNYMRRIFYPEWTIDQGELDSYPQLCFDPRGESRLEALIDRILREEESERPEIDGDQAPEGEDDFHAMARHNEMLSRELFAELKDKLAAGNSLTKADRRSFCMSFITKLNALVIFDSAGRKAGMGGLRACCERFLRNEHVEPYAFNDAAWVQRLADNAQKPVEIDDEEGRKIAALISAIQTKIKAGLYDFSAANETGLDDWLSPDRLLNGIDAALCPVFFRYHIAGRHENSGSRLFDILADGLPDRGETAWPTPLLAYALARTDVRQHLEHVLNANAREMDSLAPWIIIEMVQAGRVEEAIQLVTGQGADEALAAGNKTAFDRANCMISALKREREYTYGGVFNYLCARLPELLPDRAARAQALNSLEKAALADLFWEDNGNHHQAESLIALAGTMLRCGESDRARVLLKRLFERHKVSKDAEWALIRDIYLDAACFWYLNGDPDRMTAILGEYLGMRWCSVGP